ncbi:MAG: hypothetical protein ISR65_05295 [Bacteriovoracaceae bacterium]|nr:hypothetical protein [Bacteriovoracaceae bacterium]
MAETQQTQEKSKEDSPYVKIKIEALQNYAEGFELDIFIKLPSKYLKICHGEDDPEAVLNKYSNKRVRHVYLLTDDYHHFVTTVRALLSKKLENPKVTEPAAKVKDLSTAHDVMKTMFSENYLTEESKKLAATITNGTLKTISKGNIFKEFEKFKRNCSGEYLHAILTSYLACSLVDTNSWSTAEIKQKVVMGSLLCDIVLTEEDFKIFQKNKNNTKSLPPHILNHPYNSAEMLTEQSKFVENETLLIIKQHHERPNGKGFPHHLTAKTIAKLTAIYIVANYVTEQLFDEDFTEELKPDRLKKIMVQVKEKFYMGNFKNIYNALEELFNQDKI